VQEWRDGEAEGMTMEEYRATFGEVDVEEHPFQPVAPGGENWGQFLLRVGTALDRITHQYEGKIIVIVCHGGIVDSSFLYCFGIGALQMPRIGFDTYNTSITHWHRHKNEIFSPRPRWHLVKYNDYMHLRDMDSPVRIPWKELSRPVIGTDQPAVPLETEQ
jgi:probable phosphoglycerate mutase